MAESQKNPWNLRTNSNNETISFADIMSEDYAQQLQHKEERRYEKKLQKNWKDEDDALKKAMAADEEINHETINLEAKEHADKDVLEKSDKNLTTTSKHVKNENKREKHKQVIKDAEGEWEDYSSLLQKTDETSSNQVLENVIVNDLCDDEEIAKWLQSRYDHEYNQELRRMEQHRNKQCKVTVSLDKFMCHNDLEFLEDDDVNDADEEDEEQRAKRDWDRFETNEKIFETIPKCGFKIDEGGEMITKHDERICGVRNACRVMAFPPHFPTGDGAGFDMKLSNRVFNQLKTYSRRIGPGTGKAKQNKLQDRKDHSATAEMGVDGRTRLLLYKLVNNQILEQINGIISTGKEALILHADSDPNYTGYDNENFDIHSRNDMPNSSSSKSNKTHQQHFVKNACITADLMPKECAVKIFKTTLNEFKQRDRYIKDDYRFKDRFKSKKNSRDIINMWAEKEMHNLVRIRAAGINCPDIVILKKHILVMSFIGDNHKAAPNLKDACLTDAELSCAYEEIIQVMHKLYNEAKLVHADLSEYNILWFDGKCYLIDVAQSVEPEHPSALEFLMRDCANIINFFRKRGLPNIYTKEQLFEYITSLNAEVHNAGMLERIHTRGASIRVATAPNQSTCPAEKKPIEYPFEAAWEKSMTERAKQKQANSDNNKNAHKAKSIEVENVTATMRHSNIKCGLEADCLKPSEVDNAVAAKTVAVVEN